MVVALRCCVRVPSSVSLLASVRFEEQDCVVVAKDDRIEVWKEGLLSDWGLGARAVAIGRLESEGLLGVVDEDCWTILGSSKGALVSLFTGRLEAVGPVTMRGSVAAYSSGLLLDFSSTGCRVFKDVEKQVVDVARLSQPEAAVAILVQHDTGCRLETLLLDGQVKLWSVRSLPRLASIAACSNGRVLVVTSREARLFDSLGQVARHVFEGSSTGRPILAAMGTTFAVARGDSIDRISVVQDSLRVTATKKERRRRRGLVALGEELWELLETGVVFHEGEQCASSARRETAVLTGQAVLAFGEEGSVHETVIGGSCVVVVVEEQGSTTTASLRPSSRLFGCRTSKQDVLIASDRRSTVVLLEGAGLEGVGIFASSEPTLALGSLAHVTTGQARLLSDDVESTFTPAELFDEPAFAAAAVGGDVILVASRAGRVASIDKQGKVVKRAAAINDISTLAAGRECHALATWDGLVIVLEGASLQTRSQIQLPTDATGSAALVRSAVFFARSTLVLGLASGVVLLVDPNKGVTDRLDLGSTIGPIERLLDFSDGDRLCVIADGRAVIRFDDDAKSVVPLAPLNEVRRSMVQIGSGLAWLTEQGEVQRGSLKTLDDLPLSKSPTYDRSFEECRAVCYCPEANLLVVASEQHLSVYDVNMRRLCTKRVACEVAYLIPSSSPPVALYGQQDDAERLCAVAVVSPAALLHCEVRKKDDEYELIPTAALELGTASCAPTRVLGGLALATDDSRLKICGWSKEGLLKPAVVCHARLAACATAVSGSGSHVAVAERSLGTSVYCFSNDELQLVAVEKLAQGRLCSSLALHSGGDNLDDVLLLDGGTLRLLRCDKDSAEIRVLGYLPEDEQATDDECEAARELTERASWPASGPVAKVLPVPGCTLPSFLVLNESGALEHVRAVDPNPALFNGLENNATRPRFLDEEQGPHAAASRGFLAQLRLSTALPLDYHESSSS